MRLKEYMPNGLMLLALFAISAFIRGVVLFSYPFPPSGDVAGDLYGAAAWLGHPVLALASSPLPPPLYYFIIVIPFTHAFGIMTGTRLYMTIVPALVVFPGYLLAKNLTKNAWLALLGALLIGTSANFSLMVTWNAAFNMFGIFFMLFFIFFLQRAFEGSRVKDVLLSGLFFALVVGTHPLSALVTFVAFVLSAILLLIFRAMKRTEIRSTLKLVLLIFASMFLFSIPFIPIYYHIYAVSLVSGLAQPSQLTFVYMNFLNFPWGIQGLSLTLIVVVDILVSVLVIAELFFTKDGIKSTFLGLLIAALLLPPVETTNAVRFLYFLPILFTVGSILVFRRLDILLTKVHGAKVSTSVIKNLTGKRATVITVAVVFLLLNMSYSHTIMQQGSEFNRSLTPETLNVLKWLKNNTTENSTVYDLIGLHTWVLAYADRMDWAPSGLLIKVTNISYKNTINSDLLSLGNYVMANDKFAIAFNLNAPVGNPLVYLTSSNGYSEFSLAQTSEIIINATLNDRNLSLPLNYANLVGENNGSSAGVMWYNFSFRWASIGANVNVNASMNANSYSLNFSSNNSKINTVNYSFSILPNGYTADFANLSVTNSHRLSDEFIFNGNRVNFALTSDKVNQYVYPDGWVNVNISFKKGQTFMLNESNPPNMPRFQTSAFNLLRSLEINYVLVNYNDYTPFLRFYDNSLLNFGVNFTKVAKFGDNYIFEVNYNVTNN